MRESIQEIIGYDNRLLGLWSRIFRIWSMRAVSLTSTFTYNSDNTRFVLTDCTTSPFLHTRSLIQGPAAPPLSWLLAHPNPRVILPPEQTTILLSVDANILARSLWWYHRRNMKNVSCSSTSAMTAMCAVRWIHGMVTKKKAILHWKWLSHVTRAQLK